MPTRKSLALGIAVLTSPASGLLVPTPVTTTSAGMGSSATSTSSRRALLNGAATAAATLMLPLAAEATDFTKRNSEEFMTMDKYNKIKAQGLKDEKLYGLFENLRARAAQTGEFDKLASEDKLKEISALALAWDSNIRKEFMDKANEQLTGGDKEKGAAISKALLEDLKQLDKLAKAGDKDGVPELSAAVRSKVMQFVALEPQRLQDRFGVGDL